MRSCFIILAQNAEDVVRDMLKGFAHETKLKTGKTILHATEYMDDGSPINLTVTINETEVNQ